MLCEISFSLDNFLCTLLGGIIALISSAVIQHFQFKKEKEIWRNEKRLKLFADLIGILDSINVQIEVNSSRDFSHLETKVDVEYAKAKLKEIQNYIDKNRGMLLIFLPKGINGDLIKLSGEIFSITTNSKKQAIKMKNITNSDIFKLVEKAKSIAGKLIDEINN